MDKQNEVQEWLAFGQLDYQTAIYLQGMIPCPIEIICYHCQQAVEKYLKSYLISMDKPVIKTHDLSFLVELCISIDGEFEGIRLFCENLTDYSVTTRYPSNIELSEIDMKIAINNCSKTIEFIDTKI